MNRIREKLFLFFLVLFSGCISSCHRDISLPSLYDSSNVKTFEEYVNATPYWPSEQIQSKPNSVTIELQRDADFIVFTRENGEVLTPNIPNGKKFKDVITAKKGTRGFILPSAGTYILHIYQKKDEASNFNMEDLDFRGKVFVSEQAIKIKIEENNAPLKCERQAIYEIQNDSYLLSNETQETIINELIYIDYDEQLTKEKSKNHKNTFYKACFRYTNLTDSSLNDPKKYKRIGLLLPVRFGSVIDKGGFILKGVENNGTITYYGQPTTRTSFYSLLGTNSGQIINTFTPIGENNFEAQWK